MITCCLESLKNKFMTLFINLLTISRVILGPVIFILIISLSMYWTALILFFIASITDYFDGFLARKYNSVSTLGEVLDPIADKILIVFMLIAISIHLNSYYAAFLSSFIISREIFVAALRDLNARKSRTSATKVTYIAKVKTTLQLFSISIYLFGISLNEMLIILIADIVLFVAFIITLYTGYIYTNSTFKDDAK